MLRHQATEEREQSDVCPRFLAPFQPKQVPHFFTDVLVIGSGLAGLRAALEVDPKLSVVITTKAELQLSSSAYAQGGIAAVVGSDDCFDDHLLTHEGSCRGALVWNRQHGKTLIWAKQTLLATGGAGQIYRETTNPEVTTGDGLAMAYRAGAEVRDLEFVQFHPTVLYVAGSSRHLITEAVRGEGAYLVDRVGHRFMPDYDSRAELAPRDIVSRAIVMQMEKTRHPNVYLDLSHLDPNHVRRRFPGIASLCAQFGLDLTCDRIPVRPGAHYMMGGVTVDRDGRTTLPDRRGCAIAPIGAPKHVIVVLLQ